MSESRDSALGALCPSMNRLRKRRSSSLYTVIYKPDFIPLTQGATERQMLTSVHRKEIIPLKTSMINEQCNP